MKKFTLIGIVMIMSLMIFETSSIGAAGMIAGQYVDIIITTSGTSSYTITFGTGFKTGTATLATGTISGKKFLVHYVSDGTSLIELSRTAAL
jgi:hypothetical protein